MTKLFRFGVSIGRPLLDKFDGLIKERNYNNRSEIFCDLIREELVRRQWGKGGEIAGVITLIYDHDRRELVDKLIDIQHDYQKIIISTQHVHMDEHNCFGNNRGKR